MRPHQVIGGVADGIASGIRGVGNGLVSSVRGVGSQVMGALDKPFEMVIHKEGPHRIVDRLADGAVSAGANAVDSGIMGSLQIAGHGIMRALDQPTEQTGLPPDLGSFTVPKLLKKK